MLPGFRFLLAAIFATVTLAIGAFGVFATLRVAYDPANKPTAMAVQPMGDRWDWRDLYQSASARSFSADAAKISGGAELASMPRSAPSESTADKPQQHSITPQSPVTPDAAGPPETAATPESPRKSEIEASVAADSATKDSARPDPTLTASIAKDSPVKGAGIAATPEQVAVSDAPPAAWQPQPTETLIPSSVEKNVSTAEKVAALTDAAETAIAAQDPVTEQTAQPDQASPTPTTLGDIPLPRARPDERAQKAQRLKLQKARMAKAAQARARRQQMQPDSPAAQNESLFPGLFESATPPAASQRTTSDRSGSTTTP